MDDTADFDVPLIGPDDPPPVSIVNPDGTASVLLICDHASNAVPASLHGLGLMERDLHRHIAYDIGAAGVTIELAARLDAPAVLAGYSRLVIDCNRHLGHPESIVAESDGTVIPGNASVSTSETVARAEACFWPYHRKIGAGIAGFAMRGIKPAIIAIHGFTRDIRGFSRPWQVGVLWDKDPRIPVPLIAALHGRGDLMVGDNEPYSGQARYGYSIEVHAGETGLPNVLIELREDMVIDADCQKRVAGVLAEALAPILANETLYRTERF